MRAVLGKKIGVATSNSLEPDRLRSGSGHCYRGGSSASRRTPTSCLFRGRRPCNGSTPATNRWSSAPRRPGPRRPGPCARWPWRTACRRLGPLETTVQEYAVGNSLGVFAYDTRSTASLNAVVMSDTGSGYAERNSVFFNALEPEEAAREAIDKALRSRDPIDLPPGEYATILEEYAVAEMLFYLAYMGLGRSVRAGGDAAS